MKRSIWTALILALLVILPTSQAQDEKPAQRVDAKEVAKKPQKSPIVVPFETTEAVRPGPLDALVSYPLSFKGIKAANPCSDVVFIRRAHLDIIGQIPTPRDVLEFVRDRDPNKRAMLIDTLLEKEEFAEYWSLKWGDLLRIKAEFPINLWPNGVQTYHRWIFESLRDNKPYDRFARELLTSSGSNFRVPPVNFYRAVQSSSPDAIARVVALNLMGARFETWPEDRRAGFQAFFSRIAFKGTAEWKEQIVFLDPAPRGPLECVFPDGTEVVVPPGTDPRVVFADWLIDPENPWFARNMVNRIWSWLMGRGIVHEPDDIRPDNPPSNPQLLDYLVWEFVRSEWDIQHIFRLIINSRTYQQSSIPQSDHPEAEALFAFYPVRQLHAEVLADAFRTICGARETYSSMVPEPFTFIPPENPTITLSDGSITSPFLEMFGRPSRDTGLESERNSTPSRAQRMFLLNASSVQKGLTNSWWLKRLVKTTAKDPDRLIGSLFLTILSRGPTAAERDAIRPMFEGKNTKRQDAAIDLAWALINTKEFLFRH